MNIDGYIRGGLSKKFPLEFDTYKFLKYTENFLGHACVISEMLVIKYINLTHSITKLLST